MCQDVFDHLAVVGGRFTGADPKYRTEFMCRDDLFGAVLPPVVADFGAVLSIRWMTDVSVMSLNWSYLPFGKTKAMPSTRGRALSRSSADFDSGIPRRTELVWSCSSFIIPELVVVSLSGSSSFSTKPNPLS